MLRLTLSGSMSRSFWFLVPSFWLWAVVAAPKMADEPSREPNSLWQLDLFENGFGAPFRAATAWER